MPLAVAMHMRRPQWNDIASSVDFAHLRNRRDFTASRQLGARCVGRLLHEHRAGGR
jgi:hypothetical protein